MEEGSGNGTNPLSVNKTAKTNDSSRNTQALPPKPNAKDSDKISKLTSKVWDHFIKVHVDTDKPRAECNYCDASYASHGRNGTSALWYHLYNQCKKSPLRVVDKKQKVLHFEKKHASENGSEKASNLVAVGFSQSACRLACAKMIIVDELPFRFVEQEGFRLFCKTASPKFDPPSRKTISRDIISLYNDEKKNLKSFFVNNSHRVSLTTDTWTSIQNVNYMVLTAHFIDSNWKMQKRILNFCQISSHKGETIGKAIEACLKQWGIEKVFTITLDNASPNNGAVTYMKKRLQIWKSVVCDGDFLHVRCSAHILNLIVGDGLKELDNSITAIRNAVRYVRSSPSRLARFKNCVKNICKEENALVSLDVPTRWNSTYLMLESALKFVYAFKMLEDEDGYFLRYFLEEDKNGRRPIGPPMSTDWENCVIFCKFLKTFYNATVKFSASLHVTANIHFHEVCNVHARLLKWSSCGESILKDMATKMKTKFDKYWSKMENQNLLLYVAVVLDPRYKLKYVEFCLSKLFSKDDVKTLMDSLKSIMGKLESYYAANNSKKQPLEDKHVRVASQDEFALASDDDESSNIFESEYEKEFADNNAFGMRNEFERYLAEPPVDKKDKTFDILMWWKVNSSKYQILSNVARDVLAIQVSTVASEAAFSTGGRVLDCFRSSLNPSMVEELICCQNWLRATPLPLDLNSVLEELETYESDKSTTTADVLNLE